MAAGRDLVAKLVLQLRDNATRGLVGLQRRLEGIMAVSRRMGAIGLLGGAVSLGASIRAAAQFETGLIDLSNALGLVGDDARRARLEYAQLTESLGRRFGTSSLDVLQGVMSLLAQGMPGEEVRRVAEDMTRLMVAERVAATDAAALVFALRQVAGVPADRIAAALAQVTQAGREGGVEIRDMAGSFNSLLTLADRLGMRGETAVQTIATGLQIARRGAGDASEAINNFRNALTKAIAPETVKNFRDFGVDLPGVFRDAERRGLDFFEVFVEKLRQKAGDDPFKLTQLIADMQASAGLAPMMRFVTDYLAMRERVAGADQGLLAAGAAERMSSLPGELSRNAELLTQLGRRAGEEATPGLRLLNDALDALLGHIDRLKADMPQVLSDTAKWGAAFTALVIAGGAVGALVAVLNPVGAAIGALAAGALLVMDNWAQVEAFLERSWRSLAGGFTGLWDAAQRRFEAFVAWVRGALKPIEDVLGQIDRLMGGGADAPAPGAPPAGARPRNPFQRRLYDDDGPIRPQSAPGAATDWTGRVEIALAPGLVLRRQDTDSPAVTFAPPNRGLMLNGV